MAFSIMEIALLRLILRTFRTPMHGLSSRFSRARPRVALSQEGAAVVTMAVLVVSPAAHIQDQPQCLYRASILQVAIPVLVFSRRSAFLHPAGANDGAASGRRPSKVE